MISKKLLAAAGSYEVTEADQANGTAVSNTLLPSTVVCYTNGVSSTFNATSIDGWYRGTSGDLYTSTDLFKSEGTGNGAYGVGTTWGSASYGLSGGAFSSMGYNNNDFSLIVYTPGNNTFDQRWQCDWVRDYLPDHLTSSTESLCIEMYINLVAFYGTYSRIVHASGWAVDAPAGFELRQQGGADYTTAAYHSQGDGVNNQIGQFYDPSQTGSSGYVWQRQRWEHVSWLWDFENSRAAHHYNGTQKYSTTDSSLPTAANWSLDDNSFSNIDTFMLGWDQQESPSYTIGSTNYTHSIWFHAMELIISVDDSTKQARYGNSFTPSTTPLIAGG